MSSLKFYLINFITFNLIIFTTNENVNNNDNKQINAPFNESTNIMTSYQVNDINETFGIIEHLINLMNNSVQNNEILRIHNILLKSDLQEECLSSFKRINDAIFKKQFWAFKCKLTYD